MALTCLAAVVVVGVCSTSWADALYILTDEHAATTVLDSSAKVGEFSSQLIYLGTRSGGYEVTLAAGQQVTVDHNGKVFTAEAKKETVSRFLKRVDAAPSPMEMVAVDLSGKTVKLTVASDLTYYDRVVESVPYTVKRVANPKLAKGTERVTQKGKNGVRTAVYEVTWSEGQALSRQFVEETGSTAVDEIVEYGTAVAQKPKPSKPTTENLHSPIKKVSKNPDGSGTITLTTGEVLPFSKVRNMKATAYTAGHDGVGTVTATGTTVHRGTVAVDKRVVPLGTRMYIVTADGSYVYGLGVAEDTGYVGNNLDLYHYTYQQCINFGRRNCTVYFLK